MLKLIGKLWMKAGGKHKKSTTFPPADKEHAAQISEIQATEVGQDVLWTLSESTQREHVPRSHEIYEKQHNDKLQRQGQNRSNSLADKGVDCASNRGYEVKDNIGACENELQIKTCKGQNTVYAAGSQIILSDSRDSNYKHITRDSVVVTSKSDCQGYIAENPSLKNHSKDVTASKVNHEEINILHCTSSKENTVNNKHFVKLKVGQEEPKNINENLVSVSKKEAHLKAKNEVIKTFVDTQTLNNSQHDKTSVNNRLPNISKATSLSSSAVLESVPFPAKGSRKSVACINNLSTGRASTVSRPEKVENETRLQQLVKTSNNGNLVKALSQQTLISIDGSDLQSHTSNQSVLLFKTSQECESNISDFEEGCFEKTLVNPKEAQLNCNPSCLIPVQNTDREKNKNINKLDEKTAFSVNTHEFSIKDDNRKSAVIQGHISLKTNELQEKFSAVIGGNISVKPLSPDFKKTFSKASTLYDISDSSSLEMFLDPSGRLMKSNETHHPLKYTCSKFSADEHNAEAKKTEGLDLSIENLIDLSKGINGLHNYEGDLCTVGNQRYIKTILQDSTLVNVNTGVRELSGSGTKLGCRVLWRGQSPIPLSTVADGSKVKFDAIFIPKKKIYQALVIWEKTKPRYVTEPSTRSYIWIDSRVLTCEDVVFKAGTNYVVVQYDQKKVSAEFSKGSVFVNGKKAVISDLTACKATSATPIYATVSRLMTGRNGTTFRYVCSCVWSGIRPSKDIQLSKMFQRGEVYRLTSQNVFVQDSSPYRLYCDWPSFLKVTEQKCTLSFELENHKFSMPLSEKRLYGGNFKAQPTLSLKLPVTAHIQKISEGHWMILQVHPPKKEKDCAACASTKQIEAEVESEAGKKTQVNVLPENKPAPLQVSGKIVEEEQPSKTSSADAQKKRPAVVHDATGYLVCVNGDYGIIKIRHWEIAGYGEIIASFHRSVAYVDQWPFYKDVPFDEQIEDLWSETWHCSLRRCQKVIESVQVEYEATLAWQGRKPTKDIITYYKNAPSCSDFFYCESYKTDEKSSFLSAEKMYALSTKTNVSKTKGATAEYSSRDLVSDEIKNLALDDADLYPTSAADDERDIVEVSAVESLQSAFSVS